MNPFLRIALILIITGVIAPIIINTEIPVTMIVLAIYGMAMVATWLLKDPVILLLKKVREMLDELD